MLSVYKERDTANYILENGFATGKKFYELSLISKLFWEQRKDKDFVKKQLIEFCYKYYRDFNEIRQDDMIRSLVKSCHRYELRQIESVPITAEEIEHCKNCVEYGNIPVNMVYFALLVLAKICYQQKGTKYASASPSALMKMTQIKTKSVLFKHLRYLYQKGYIRPCTNGNFEWLGYMDTTNKEIEIVVRDIDYCGVYYKNHLYHEYKECDRCGRLMRKSNNKKKYCRKCADYVKKEQDSIRKYGKCRK